MKTRERELHEWYLSQIQELQARIDAKPTFPLGAMPIACFEEPLIPFNESSLPPHEMQHARVSQLLIDVEQLRTQIALIQEVRSMELADLESRFVWGMSELQCKAKEHTLTVKILREDVRKLFYCTFILEDIA
jgi:hypothetical protein